MWLVVNLQMAKTCETTVTGHGVTSGLEFWDCTRTFGTHGCDTTGLPIPVLHPIHL